MCIKSKLIEIEESKAYKDIEKQIIAEEKLLLGLASDEVREIYKRIDFLCCKQNELMKEALIKLR